MGVVNLCTILGSLSAPHVFLSGEEKAPDASVRSAPEEGDPSLLGLHETESGANPMKTEIKVPLPKGGELKTTRPTEKLPSSSHCCPSPFVFLIPIQFPIAGYVGARGARV